MIVGSDATIAPPAPAETTPISALTRTSTEIFERRRMVRLVESAEDGCSLGIGFVTIASSPV